MRYYLGFESGGQCWVKAHPNPGGRAGALDAESEPVAIQTAAGPSPVLVYLSQALTGIHKGGGVPILPPLPGGL